MDSKCLTKGCDQEKSRCRGVCAACYQRLYRLVRQKQVTWEELVAAGCCTNEVRGRKVHQHTQQILKEVERYRKRVKQAEAEQEAKPRKPPALRKLDRVAKNFVGG